MNNHWIIESNRKLRFDPSVFKTLFAPGNVFTLANHKTIQVVDGLPADVEIVDCKWRNGQVVLCFDKEVEDITFKEV